MFDYLRNDVLDANDWFGNRARLAKPRDRQNDFGGTFGGPILRDRAFFFFSYEGLRLRLPQVALTTVPDVSARQTATPGLQPFLNAYPLPNGQDNTATGIAQFNAPFSNRSSLDAYSIRIDHRLLKDKLALFGRYNYSPSEILQRGAGSTALSQISVDRITTQTATVGGTWTISPSATNDLRFNYSRIYASSYWTSDNFGGAVPLTALPLPSPYTAQNGLFQFAIFSLINDFLYQGKNAHQLQRQINIVDNASVQKGSHGLKFGVDFRRLTPLYDPELYAQSAYFSDVASAKSGSLLFSLVDSSRNGTLLFRNLGVFAQDTWRAASRLTLAYGLRWDVDFAPSSIDGPSLAAATNFNDPAKLALAPAGTPVFNTPYGNVAPRIGIAYQLSQNSNWQTVLRGGFGVFFDLATQEVGNGILWISYPFGASRFMGGGSFPLDAASAAPPPITFAGSGWLAAFYPNLQLPYTLQWNVALQQTVGTRQTITGSYIGSAGRRLMQTMFLLNPNANVNTGVLLLNGATSDYDALQVQFERRMSHGLQALASYTWSHSIDSASAGSWGNGANTQVPSALAGSNRGPSDFDIRDALSAAITYDIPFAKINAFTNAILRGWSLQSIIQARSAPPVGLSDVRFFKFNGGFYANVRPDLILGKPLYLFGSQYAGGQAFNPAAFADPPADPNTPGAPIRQGNVGRNALRGFGATQWDFAVHREFPIRESLKFQLRAEMFNVLNHPNFGPPNGQFGTGGFGLSTQMLGASLVGFNNLGGGAFNPLYQIGGPRSIQFGLKFSF